MISGRAARPLTVEFFFSFICVDVSSTLFLVRPRRCVLPGTVLKLYDFCDASHPRRSPCQENGTMNEGRRRPRIPAPGRAEGVLRHDPLRKEIVREMGRGIVSTPSTNEG